MFRLMLCLAALGSFSARADLVRSDAPRCELEARLCELTRANEESTRWVAAFSVTEGSTEQAQEMIWDQPASPHHPLMGALTRGLNHTAPVRVDEPVSLEAASRTPLAHPTDVQFPGSIGVPTARFSRTTGSLN